MWLFILFCEVLVTNNPLFAPSGANALLSMNIYNSSGIIPATATFFTNLGNYFKAFLDIITLYQPTVFSGNYIYLWYMLCLPVDIGMIFSVVTIIRGVHSS
jgi:hypothetical protein